VCHSLCQTQVWTPCCQTQVWTPASLDFCKLKFESCQTKVWTPAGIRGDFACRPNQGACWATYCGPIWPWDKSNWGRWFCRAKVLKSYCTVTLPKSVGLCCSSTIQKSPSRLFCIVCYWRKRWFAHPWAFHCYSIRLEVSNRLIAPIVTRSNNLKLLITWYDGIPSLMRENILIAEHSLLAYVRR